ncbi:hypothetical protein F5B20DRAFT_554791 [Whalleya microplaca]|nr:hypothetical protein F5B20DRAFT_554791 [Whalleya microplaca]
MCNFSIISAQLITCDKMMPLASLREWAPFQLDALGLVTLFGAKEMHMSIGNLTQGWFTEWLPILGSYAVANNEIAQSEPGFFLYNITDGYRRVYMVYKMAHVVSVNLYSDHDQIGME